MVALYICSISVRFRSSKVCPYMSSVVDGFVCPNISETVMISVAFCRASSENARLSITSAGLVPALSFIIARSDFFHPFSPWNRPIHLLKNSFFFVRTCDNSSIRLDRLICLSMSLFYHIFSLCALGLCGVALTLTEKQSLFKLCLVALEKNDKDCSICRLIMIE